MDDTDPSTESSLRRRVQRACDQCRRRKTRCNGESHCRSCFDIGLRCSYSNRAKVTSGPRYIAHLEHKVDGLEAQIRKLSVGSAEQSNPLTRDVGSDGQSDSGGTLYPVDSTLSSSSGTSSSSVSTTPYPGASSGVLVDTLYLDSNQGDGGRASVYRGRTTGVEIMRSLRHLLDSFVGFPINPDHAAAKLVGALDSQTTLESLPTISFGKSFFSPGPALRKWIDLAFDESFVLWPFIDRELVSTYVQRLLGDGSPDQHGCDSDQLGLLHAIIALGQRHDPNLIAPEDEPSQLPETRGIRHFAAARELVPLEDCSRSVTAVQAVMCMAIYLKSVSAQRVVHSYVSTACYAAYQLGLHDTADALDLPEKERVVRQRILIALRIFDAYVTSSLGLPRNLRVVKATNDPTDAPYIESSEMLTATNANLELLEILSTTRESIFFADATKGNKSPNLASAARLQELSATLDRWALKNHIFTRTATPSKAGLFLRFSHCFVLLVLYCPFLHHILKPEEQRSPCANTAASQCVEAAIETVHVMEEMNAQGILCEAYAFTVDALAMAATSLLVVELGAPGDNLGVRAKPASGKAKVILETLALRSCAAARCLESLAPLYQGASAITELFSESVDQLLPDSVIFPRFNGEVPVWELPETHSVESHTFEPVEPTQTTTNPLNDSSEYMDYSVDWRNWGFGGFMT